jgi:hypothetical protein
MLKFKNLVKQKRTLTMKLILIKILILILLNYLTQNYNETNISIYEKAANFTIFKTSILLIYVVYFF